MRTAGITVTPATARRLVIATTLLAAVLYGWGLAGDPTHPYYTAAVRSMSLNWHNFFYGAFDPRGFITTDKLPGSFWIDALFVRLLGFHNWVVLLPQVLAATACVPLLFSTVRRWAGTWAALCAIGLFTLTPITVALARTNIPDALMVFFLVLAADAFWRGFPERRYGWLLACAVWLAVAFQVKMGQALLVVPVFGGVLLLASRGRIGGRMLLTAGFGLATGVLCVSWMALVSLVPAAGRPYIDGSMHDSVWEMVFQYNGLGRMGGQDAGTNPLAGGAVLLDADGAPGLDRIFGAQTAGQISWLIPVALLALVVGLWRCGRAPLGDLRRIGWLFWGGWFAVYSAAFCLASGIHPYYTTSLAPAIAAMAGTGLASAARMWLRRERGALLLPLMVLTTGIWAFAASHETPRFQVWLRWSVLDAAIITATLLAWVALRGPDAGRGAVRGAGYSTEDSGANSPNRGIAVSAVESLGYGGGYSARRLRMLRLLSMPMAFALVGAPATWAASVLVQHRASGGGNSAAAGPVQPWRSGGMSGGHHAGAVGGVGQAGGDLTAAALRSAGDCAQPAPYAKTAGDPNEPANSDKRSVKRIAPGIGTGAKEAVRTDTVGTAADPETPGVPSSGTAQCAGGMHGVNPHLVAFLTAHQGEAEFAVAMTSSMTASPYISAGLAVLPIGGFTGDVPVPTVNQLAALVAKHQLRYVDLGGMRFGGGPATDSRTVWVMAHCSFVPAADYGSQPPPTSPGITVASTRSAPQAGLFDCQAPPLVSAVPASAHRVAQAAVLAP
jgi:4-amino-4-deoxy-L-arabinose transferase-like glycosyltransferase